MKQILSMLIVVFGVVAIILALIWLTVSFDDGVVPHTKPPPKRCCCCDPYEKNSTP